MSLGTQIKAARTALGLTQEALAEALGVVPQTISKWERDESQPDAALLPALADALETSLDTLFERQKGAHGDAEEALKRWLLPLPERERMKEMRKLWKSCVLEGTAESRAETLADPDTQHELWEALADGETRRAILRSYTLTPGLDMGCDRGEMAALLGLEKPEETLPKLEKLHLLSVVPCVIDGEQTELLHISPNHKPLALMLLAAQLFGLPKPGGELNAVDAGSYGRPLLSPKE